MTLLCQAGSAIRHAIDIIVLNYRRIRPVSNATRIVLRSGPVLEMAIYAQLLKTIMAEGQVILLMTSHGVKETLIRVTIFLNSDARIVLHLLIQNVLQVILVSVATYVNIEEVVLAHTCLVEVRLVTKFFIAE
jgi:hypothetical protein